ncbi:MAG: ATP-binding protein [Dokdonella sp.]
MRLASASHLQRLLLVYGVGLLLAFGVVGGVSLWAFGHLLERDIERSVTMDSEGLMEVFRTDGPAGLAATINERTGEPENRDTVYVLIGSDHKVLAGRPTRHLARSLPRRGGWIRFHSASVSQGEEVLAYVHTLPGGGWLVTGHTTGEHARSRELITRLGTVSLILLALLTILLGWLLRRSIDRALMASLDTVDRVASGHLNERVPEQSGQDGFARLGRTLNRMLDRIQDLVGGIQSSTDAIAHDLRTPLMRLKARLETIATDRGDDRRSSEMDAAIAEVDQLVATFNSLLRLARIESVNETPSEIVALDEIVADASELWQALAESRGQSLNVQTMPTRIAGDRDLLFQMISNLLDNAIKYADCDTEITVSLQQQRDEVLLVISDQGPGIDNAQRERVFDRFVRLEPHRGTAGSGLGLSVVRAIAIRHRADLRLEAANPGLRVRLAFPASPHITNP